MKKNTTIICDMQFGSCGKGAVAGYIATQKKPDTVVTAWGPNAGHTFIAGDGKKFVHRALANGVVSPKLKRIMIAPGSILDIPRLRKELIECLDYTENAILLIHEHTTVLKNSHIELEEITMVGIGSTRKGSGAALIEKLKRQTDNKIIAKHFVDTIEDCLGDLIETHVVNTPEWQQYLNLSDEILVEGAQGFSLGVNSGFYPYCTSRECTPTQIMSDTLISKNRVKKVIGVMRTFPIRVANRYDKDGNMIGYSGPVYPDQKEIQWDSIGVPPELTTVTKLPRRVFGFSVEQTKMAMLICGPDEIWLSFCDYLPEKELHNLKTIIDNIADDVIPGAGVKYMSFGPKINDVKLTHGGWLYGRKTL